MLLLIEKAKSLGMRDQLIVEVPFQRKLKVTLNEDDDPQPMNFRDSAVLFQHKVH